MRWPRAIALLIVLGAGLFGWMGLRGRPSVKEGPLPRIRRTVLYVDSYDPNYTRSREIQLRTRQVLEAAGVTMRSVYLNSRLRPEPTDIEQAALLVKAELEASRPDLVIAADDAASRYVVMPFLRDSNLPVVFCGINWDTNDYGYPYPNTTGLVEIDMIGPLVAELRKHARGNRMGFLSGSIRESHKALAYCRDVLGLTWDQISLVSTFEAWKEAWVRMQNDVDLLVFRGLDGITGWDGQAAALFVQDKTSIPTGTISGHVCAVVVVSFLTEHAEFGRYSADTALDILAGRRPDRIPLTTNRQMQVRLNMRLAKALGIRFDIDLIERALFVE